MKRLLLIVLPLLLIVGCSKSVDEETLIEKDDVYYSKDTNKPYSGKVFSLYEDGKKKSKGTYKNGKWDGLWTGWFENGQKEWETNFKDGEYDGFMTYWYENGQKRWEGNYIDGVLISVKEWNEDGSVKE